MKRLSAATLALSLLLAPVATALGATALGASFAQDPKQKQAEFESQFKKAMSIGSKAEMQRLVTKNTDQAVIWIIDTAELISVQPSDPLYERMSALREAWKEGMKTDFCDKMEKYFSLIDPVTKRERVKLKKDYQKKVGDYYTNLNGPKDVPAFTKLGVEMEGLALGFEQLGDYYYTSQSYGFVAACFDEVNAKKSADLKRAAVGYEKMISNREKIGLKDNVYKAAKPRLAQLVGLGFGSATATAAKAGADAAGGAAAGGAAEAGAAASSTAPVEAAMVFELIPKLDAYERPNYFLDELYPMWNSISLNKKGSRTAIPRLEDAPDVLRLGSADVKIDLTRDGEGNVDIPLTGRMEPVIVELGEGESKRQWAFLAVTGLERDTYQKLELNLAPSDDLINIYVIPAGSLTGEVNGTKIKVFDDNMDGVYGSAPQAWGHVGMSPDHFQPELDSILIGSTKRALPWSEYQKIGDQWYKFEVQGSGTKLVAYPVQLRTGTLKLKYKGPAAGYVVVKGSNDYENSFFDLAGDKEVEVPIGRYSLHFGIVSKGKKKQMMKAVMIPGDNSPNWDVLEEGQEVEVALGSPFGFDFNTSIEDEEIIIDGRTVVVTGSADERYERIWNAVPRPDASYRKAGSKRGSKGETMDLIMDQDQMAKFGGWASVWHPLDIVLAKRASEEEVEVQLVEKKNKLFGKIESAWK